MVSAAPRASAEVLTPTTRPRASTSGPPGEAVADREVQPHQPVQAPPAPGRATRRRSRSPRRGSAVTPPSPGRPTASTRCPTRSSAVSPRSAGSAPPPRSRSTRRPCPGRGRPRPPARWFRRAASPARPRRGGRCGARTRRRPAATPPRWRGCGAGRGSPPRSAPRAPRRPPARWRRPPACRRPRFPLCSSSLLRSVARKPPPPLRSQRWPAAGPGGIRQVAEARGSRSGEAGGGSEHPGRSGPTTVLS